MKFYLLVFTLLIYGFSNSILAMAAGNSKKKLAFFLCRNCVNHKIMPTILRSYSRLKNFNQFRHSRFKRIFSRDHSSAASSDSQNSNQKNKMTSHLILLKKAHRDLIARLEECEKKKEFYNSLNIHYHLTHPKDPKFGIDNEREHFNVESILKAIQDELEKEKKEIDFIDVNKSGIELKILQLWEKKEYRRILEPFYLWELTNAKVLEIHSKDVLDKLSSIEFRVCALCKNPWTRLIIECKDCSCLYHWKTDTM